MHASVLGGEGAEKYHTQQEGLRSKFVNQDYDIQTQEVKSSVPCPPPPLTPTVAPPALSVGAVPRGPLQAQLGDSHSTLSLLLLFLASSPFPLLTLSPPGASTSSFQGMRRGGCTGRGQPFLNQNSGMKPPTPRLRSENLRRGVGLSDRAWEEGESHAGVFHQVPAPLWFQGRLWTFTTTTLFLGIFLEKAPRAQSRKDTGL